MNQDECYDLFRQLMELSDNLNDQLRYQLSNEEYMALAKIADQAAELGEAVEAYMDLKGWY